jgi:hypothetical protein
MAQLLVANNLSVQTNTSVSSSATSIAVVAGQGARFPAVTGGNWMYLAAWMAAGAFEIFKLTAVAGDNLTVVRGQDGTTGTAWASGTTLFCITLNAAAVADLRTQLGAAALTGVTMTGQLSLAGDPTSALHPVTKQYADANFWPSNTLYQTKWPHAPAELVGTNSVVLNWGSPVANQLNLLANSTNAGYLWTTVNFNPATKAPRRICAWAAGINEWAGVGVGNVGVGSIAPAVLDPGSPWALEGIRWVPTGAATAIIYNRVMWMTN